MCLNAPFGHSVKTRIQGTDESVPQAELPDALKAAQSQTKGKAKAKGILPILFKIWKKDGLGGFYNGFLANMLNTFSMRGCCSRLRFWTMR